MNAPYLRVTGGTPVLLLVLPDPNGYIRTNLSANGATGAGTIVVPDYKEIALTVDFLSDPDQLLRTGNGAKTTSFTTLTINFNFSNHFAAIQIPITKFRSLVIGAYLMIGAWSLVFMILLSFL
jgi:hypothetical protein